MVVFIAKEGGVGDHDGGVVEAVVVEVIGEVDAGEGFGCFEAFDFNVSGFHQGFVAFVQFTAFAITNHGDEVSLVGIKELHYAAGVLL